MPNMTETRCWSLSRCRRYFEADPALVELIDSGDLDAIHAEAERLSDAGHHEQATVLIVAAARIRGGSR